MKITSIADFECMYGIFCDPHSSTSCLILHTNIFLITQWMHDVVHGGDVQAADTILGQIDLYQLDSQLITAILKNTHRISDFLENWLDVLEKGKMALISRGMEHLYRPFESRLTPP